MRTRLLVVVLIALALPPAATNAASFTVTRVDDPPPDGCQPADCSPNTRYGAAATDA